VAVVRRTSPVRRTVIFFIFVVVFMVSSLKSRGGISAAADF
jgi:hypothetical protein